LRNVFGYFWGTFGIHPGFIRDPFGILFRIALSPTLRRVPQ
jgi:hypothetical protein